VIPPVTTSSQARYDFALCCQENLIERSFLKLKHVRRIATRYEQTAHAYMTMLSVVAAFI